MIAKKRIGHHLSMGLLAAATAATAAEKSYTYKDGVKEEYRLQTQAQAPTLDGRIDEAEWRNATQIDGFSDDQRRVRGYVLATKDAFHLAIRSQLPEVGDLVTNVDRDNTAKMVFDDSIEFWIGPDPAAPQGKRFQFMTNPNSRRWASLHGRGGVDSVKDWQADWETKSAIHDDLREWHCEARIPVSEMSGLPITAQAWTVNLWRNWKNPWLQTFMIGRMFDGIQGTWHFSDESAPAVHLRDRANRFTGDMQLALDIVNPGPAPMELKARLRLERDSGDDAVEEQTVTVAPGATAAVSLKLDDKASKNCRLSAEVTDATGETVYFRHNKLWKVGKAIPWEAPVAVPKTDLKFRCGYYPSDNLLKTAADLRDMPENAKVAKVNVTVREKESGKVVASVALDQFVSGRQELDIPLPADLDGDYEVVARAEGENVPDETITALIKRQHFEWEGNTLGITNEVFPPFEPLQADGRKVSPVLRTYTMNEQGLWDSVVAKDRELLAAPVRYVALTQDGQELPWQGEVKLVSTQPHEVVYRAEAASAAVAIEAVSTVEMDGLMKVRLTLKPVKDAVPLERLSLEIENTRAEGSPLADRQLEAGLQAVEVDRRAGNVHRCMGLRRRPGFVRSPLRGRVS